MHASLSFWILPTGLVAMTIIIWLPYLLPWVGYHFRRSEGPWLINFNHASLFFALMRDLLYTIGLWFGLMFLHIFLNTLYFWLIFVVGMVGVFGSAFISDRFEQYHRATPSIRVYSSQVIRHKELQAFFASIGAFIPGKQQPYLARVSYPNGFVWIDDLSAVFQKLKQRQQKRHKDWEEVAKIINEVEEHLGSEAKTLLYISVLNASNVEHGEIRALNVIYQFSLRYPCVVEDAYGNYHSSRAIYEAQKNDVLLLGFQARLTEKREVKQQQKL